MKSTRTSAVWLLSPEVAFPSFVACPFRYEFSAQAMRIDHAMEDRKKGPGEKKKNRKRDHKAIMGTLMILCALDAPDTRYDKTDLQQHSHTHTQEANPIESFFATPLVRINENEEITLLGQV